MKNIFSNSAVIGTVFLVSLLIISTNSLTNTGGASGGHTNAPSEGNCTSCHNGILQVSGTNYNNLTLTGNFTGNGYIPDSTYTITLSYTHSGKNKFGYQLTCLDNQNKMAGSFSLISGNNKSRINSRTISGSSRNYMNHTSSGTSGSGSNSWDFQWTAPSSNLGDVTFYTVVNSTNSNGSTSGDIIIAKEFVISPSDSLPSVSASASQDTVCAGELVSLEGITTDSVSSWLWTVSNATPSTSSSKDVSVRFQFPGKYNAIIVAKNKKGFSQPDTVSIEVLPRPSAFIPGPSVYTICEGDSVDLETNLVAGVTYTWNNGTMGNRVVATEEGEYYVNAELPNGCGRQSNRITIQFRDKPNLTLSSDAQLQNDSSCTESIVNLWANTSIHDSFYFYADGILEVVTKDSFAGLNFDSTTVFGLQVRDTFGCLSDIEEYEVLAKDRIPAPTLSCTTNDPTSISFEWTSIFSHTGYEISLDSGDTWQSPNGGPQSTSTTVTGLQPNDSVNFMVRGLDVPPCGFSSTAEKTCDSKSCDPLDVTVTFDSSICRGDLWNIEVNGLSRINYSLELDNGGTFTDTLIAFNPLISNDYILSIVDSNNLVCPATEIKIPLTIDAIFDIQLKADKVGAFCEGEEVTFSANDSIENFDFYLNENLVQSGSSNEYTSSNWKQRDSIYVVVSKGACIDTSETLFVNIALPADASFTYTRSGSEYTFTPTVTDNAVYNWDFGDGSPISNDVTPTHDYVASEGNTVNVQLSVKSGANCDASESESILLPMFSSVEDLTSLNIRFYPNPVTDKLVVENQTSRKTVISIYSLQGSLIAKHTTELAISTIDIESLTAGTYLIKFDQEGLTRTSRLIKK